MASNQIISHFNTNSLTAPKERKKRKIRLIAAECELCANDFIVALCFAVVVVLFIGTIAAWVVKLATFFVFYSGQAFI